MGQQKLHRALLIENLELTQLRLIEAIAETGSLSAAAVAVGLSQSAASHSLARLRAQAGDPLFVRTFQKMQPTPYGEQLAATVRSALLLLREGLRNGRTFTPETAQRTFSLYMSEAGQLAMLPTLQAHLSKHAPGVRIHVHRLPDDRQGEALESGQVDMAIGHISTMTTGFHQRLLFHERYVCVASLDNRLFARGMSVEAFARSPHAVADSSGMAHWVIDQTLSRHRIGRRVGLIVPEFLALPFVISGSDLIATMPSRVARHFAQILPLRVMPMPVPFDSYEILLFWHKRVHADPANQWLRQTLATLFAPMELDLEA